MRWQPDVGRCPECSFDWTCDIGEGIRIVARAPSDVEEALAGVPAPTTRDGAIWSASMYVWHLVDVLRIGAERLLTLSLDPGAGIPCWDENALASVRKYELLSPVVGIRMLEAAARDWSDAAEVADDRAVVEHAEFGSLGALDLIRRNAHEVVHHTGDIRRRRVG